MNRSRFLLIAFLVTSCTLGLAQTSADDSYKSDRHRAIELYNADKCMEALPLFEDLAKRDPQDSGVLVGLGACLINESATLEDQDAAAKERIRARTLLLKAQQLGNNSTLVQNLLQTIPENGVVSYEASAAGQAMRAGEAAFARHDFDEAIKNYSKVLELQPTNYSAALFIGDSYFADKKFDPAKEWYGKAAKIDPNRETAYRYEADMLTRNGDMESARKLAIEAVVAEPYNAITWRGLQEWARANKVQLNPIHINTPNSVSQKDDTHININIDPNQSKNAMSVWLVYSMSRAKWRGDDFKKRFPEEKAYRHSLPEESEALNVAATVLLESSGKKDKNKKKSELPKDPDLALLLKLSSSNMIEPYVLLSAADEGISHDYESYRQQNRAKLEQYLSDFVVPAAPKP
jgi:tetratricopeptide (TPR) repeat protein